MLARRFTIVCLLLTVFSMFFAGLVAQAGRTERRWQQTVGTACAFDPTLTCGATR